jgi:hypothetical protein
MKKGQKNATFSSSGQSKPLAKVFSGKPFLNAIMLETILPDDSRKAVQYQWPKS